MGVFRDRILRKFNTVECDELLNHERNILSCSKRQKSYSIVYAVFSRDIWGYVKILGDITMLSRERNVEDTDILGNTICFRIRWKDQINSSDIHISAPNTFLSSFIPFSIFPTPECPIITIQPTDDEIIEESLAVDATRTVTRNGARTDMMIELTNQKGRLDPSLFPKLNKPMQHRSSTALQTLLRTVHLRPVTPCQ